jgi:copper homeostasis protein
MIVEICANSFESAVAAQKAGADRIELCTELSVGGLTPSFGLLDKVLSTLSIPVHVLIRPRTGNFSYSEAELEIMIKDIRQCKMLGATGIVSGMLTDDYEIDRSGTSKLKEASSGMEFTFHRAFDWCRDPSSSLNELMQLNITRLLSSGQQNQAIDGLSLLKELKKISANKIEIMPGGGININNVLLFKASGFDSVHFSASEKIQTLPERPKVSMQSAVEEGVISFSSFEKIQEILNVLRK